MARIHSPLTRFADGIRSTLAASFAYLMTLALLAIGAWEHLLDAMAMESPGQERLESDRSLSARLHRQPA